MVVREATFLPSPRAMSAPLVDWARLPQRCCVKDLDPAEERTEQHVGKFFTGQQEPCVASPCAGCLPPAAGEDEHRRRQETLQNNRNECCWEAGRGTPVNQDKRRCLVCSAHMDRGTEKDTESKFAESEDCCCSLVTDSDLHFPPILESQVKSVEQDQGSSSPTLTRTFAQVVSKDFGSGVGVEAEKNCWEETMCSPRPEQVSDQGSSGETCGRDPIDKSDGRYVTRLEFTIKCGYSESGLDKVISRLGLECDKNLLLQELVRNCSGSERLECREFPNDVSHEEHDPKTMSQDRGKLVNAKDEPQTVSHDGGRVVNAEDDPKTVSADRVEVTAVADGEGAGALEETKRDGRAEPDDDKNLRHIIIDGSNVAMSHGKSVFSCRGIQIAVDWFRGRGHQDITVFVPQWRKEAPRLDSPITDQGLLLKLAEDGVVAFTPARRVKGRRVVCYDDRYILRLAAHTGGVVVSNDNYRDLVKESQEFRSVVEERLLMYTFVSDRFMPPEDPLGRMGPTLDNFLRKQPSNEQTVQAPCPYGRKCTFGTKCKYGHPERGAGPHKMVSEVLKEQASRRMQERNSGGSPDDHGITSSGRKSKLARTHSLQYGEHLGGETRSLVLPSPLFLPEADSCIDSRRNSPPRSSGKTSDYLSEHRKKLEKDLAMAALADARSTSVNVISHETRESNTVGQYKVGLDGASVFPVQMSPYSCHHTSLASGCEGRLISGHLLLAKKLSDEALGSSFFSQEDLSIQQRSIMTSPPLEIHQTNFPSSSNDRYQNRRSSLPDRYHHHQPLYRRVPSVPHHTNNTLTTYASESTHQLANPLSAFPYYRATVPEFESPKMTCPTSETNALDNAWYIGQYSVCDTVTYPRFTERGSRPFQNGHPSDKILVPSADFPSGQPDSGSMEPRNSYSGPQHRIPGTGDTFRGDPRYPPCPPFTLQSSTDSLRSSPMHRSTPERASHSDTNHQQYYNPCQLHAARAFHPQHPQTGEGMFSPPPDTGVPVISTGHRQWGRGGTYPNQRVASFHPPQSPHRPLPPPPPPLLSGCDVSRWQLNSPPPMTPLPGSPVQPGCGDSGHPIAVTDPRYPLYLHLCDTFAQHRVQAVMNKYPEVTDLQKLCVCLLSEL